MWVKKQEPCMEPTDWFKIEKGLFDLYTVHIMRNAGLDELQAGIKVGVRNIKTSDMQMIPL